MKLRNMLGTKFKKWDGMIASSFAGGSGSSNDPYIIETPQQLAYFVNQIMGTKTVFVKIVNDLDLNNIEWLTVATRKLSTSYNTCVDGGGHLISHLKLTSNTGYTGLFMGYGWLTLSNLGVISGTIIGTNNTAMGTFGGRMSHGFVKNCFSRANINTDKYYTGGIIGYGAQTDDVGGRFSVENCYYAGTIAGGGFKSGIMSVLSNGTTVSNCWNNSTTNPSQNGHSYNAPNKTASEMKAIAFISQLGTAYKMDNNYKNEGYPILKT